MGYWAGSSVGLATELRVGRSIFDVIIPKIFEGDYIFTSSCNFYCILFICTP